jgi:hypothetical protein
VIQRLKKAQKKREERSKEYLNQIVEKMKTDVKDEKEYLELCEKYNKNKDFIDEIEITFEPLDVSAKTINGKIILNEKLIDAPWKDKMRYLIHETTHVLQQEVGKVDGKTKKEDYLDDPNEQEAFKAQISYMEKKESPEEIQEYIEELLDHHNIRGKERKEKKEELTNE